MQLLVAGLLLAIIAVVGLAGVTQAQGTAPPSPTGITAVNDPNAGQVNLTWTEIPGASSYRVGWLADEDYRAYSDTWQEKFAYSDVTANSSYTLTRLTPGILYYLIVGRKHDDGISWSQWATLTLNDDASSCPTAAVSAPTPTPTPTPQPTLTPTRAPVAAGDYDSDNDGLIEVSNLEQLNAIRFDLGGSGSSGHSAYARAFPNARSDMGCPNSVCSGYELVANLNFDTNGNGQADAGDTYWNDGSGWAPIGSSARQFGATFDGNLHTISNLSIKRGAIGDEGRDIGLFGYTSGASHIKDLGLLSANIRGYDDVGALVGENWGTVEGSYSTGTVVGINSVGGLIGDSRGPISGSYSKAETGSSWSRIFGERVGGLVGYNDNSIIASYATGSISGNEENVGGLVGLNGGNGSVASSYATGSVSGTDDDIGGLVGDNRGSVATSYATGRVSGPGTAVYVGGLVGYSEGNVTGSYWDTQTSGQADSYGGTGKTTRELQSPTSNTGIYATWSAEYWDFGTSSQYPVLKYRGLSVAVQR